MNYCDYETAIFQATFKMFHWFTCTVCLTLVSMVVCLTVLCSSFFHQWFPAWWHQNTELLETLGQATTVETAILLGPSANRAKRKSFTSYSVFQRKYVPFQEISHFNSIKFFKLEPRVGASERQRFYTACNPDSIFFAKTKTMSSPHHLTQQPKIENTTSSLKHNYTITFLANSLVKTLIFLEWKHKPQRERDGETETEERNKDQLHKPFSCFIRSSVATPTPVWQNFIPFLKKTKKPRCSSEENINQAAAGEFVQDMKWVTHGYQVPGRRLAHREGNKIRCKGMMPTHTLDLKHSIIINFKMNCVQFIVLLRSPFPFKTLQLQNGPSQTHTNYYIFRLFVLFVWSAKWTCANDDDPWFWSTTGIW